MGFKTGLAMRVEGPEVHLVFPTLPPALDGIGDYTARLASALAAQSTVSILTAQADAEPIAGVTVRQVFSVRPPTEIRRLVESIRSASPDWMVLQYNPFSYGRFGFNPWLVSAVREAKRICPEMRFGLMIHEPFVPLSSFKFAAMAMWQRRQLLALGRTADLVLCSIDAWTERFRRWFTPTRVQHLPVGSNIPDFGWSRREARQELGVEESAFVVGLFGAGFTKGMHSFVKAALEALAQRVPALEVLYVGKRGADLRSAADQIPFSDLGPLSASAVSRTFSAMDLYLAPYPDGISTRRGSAIAALQHGVPLLSTYGHLTDPVLIAANGTSLVLAPVKSAELFAACAADLCCNPQLRARIGRGGHELHDALFSWERIAEKMLGEMAIVDRRRRLIGSATA